ncbi:MAG: prepilin-type N-terminal cleavage/methylation domain-containing protein [Candidatus Riflebacteria bacterium]|nr:prepilin-type N-terminal cleavage/methylation domain-containing protein [Candidatus Riflebacteria bacterium]
MSMRRHASDFGTVSLLPRASNPEPGAWGFTLVELLVTVAILLALTLMASGIYIQYVKWGEEAVLGNNLNTMRGALQQFYADNGRYPFHGKVFDVNVGFLDDSTSELRQGALKFARKDEKNWKARRGPRVQYLDEIPLDPSTNSKDWTLTTQAWTLPTPDGTSQLQLSVVTGVYSSNPMFDGR